MQQSTDWKLAQIRQITIDFFNDPLCVFFVRPYEDLDKKMMSEYNNRIKKPMDLGTVKKKIKDGMYPGYQSWIDDMNLIWDNAIEFNTPESLLGGVAIYLKKKFNKKIMMLNAQNLRNYEQRLIDLAKELNQIISNTPPIFNITSSLQWPEEMEPFTIKRIEEIKEGVHKLDEAGRTEDILNIIRKAMPDLNIDTSTPIDFGLLGRNALLGLEKFIKENPI